MFVVRDGFVYELLEPFMNESWVLVGHHYDVFVSKRNKVGLVAGV